MMSSNKIEKFLLTNENSDRFIIENFLLSYVKETGKTNTKNCVIIMDNVKFHLSKNVTDLLEENFYRTIYIPCYSPQYNRIEYMFGIIKKGLKKS